MISQTTLTVLLDKAVVLMVDDTPKNLQILGEALEGQGYEVAAALSGAQAFSVLATEKVDLILLDIMMPEMDGFEVCRRLKANSSTQDVPIIFLTARTEQEDVIAGLKLGAVDYVTKPFNVVELLTRVRTHLELKIARELYAAQSLELQRTNGELNEALSMKNQMLSVASHDLKSPLSAITTIAGMLQALPVIMENSQASKFVGLLDESAQRMTNLIQEVLDTAALEMGRMRIELQRLNLYEVLEAVVAHYEGTALKKQQRIVVEAPNNEILAYADGRRIRQVLDNLMSNAIKYSPKNTTVRVVLKERDGKAVMEIHDEGPGFSAEDKRQIFGYFQRLSARPTAGESSNGVGLAIAKQIVHLHGGTIIVDSDREGGRIGSTFIVELPFIRDTEL